VTLCDASALIALLSKNDNNHQRCVAVLESLSEKWVENPVLNRRL